MARVLTITTLCTTPEQGLKSSWALGAPVARVPSMPRAATAIPYMLASEKLMKMTTASTTVGTMHDW